MVNTITQQNIIYKIDGLFKFIHFVINAHLIMISCAVRFIKNLFQ